MRWPWKKKAGGAKADETEAPPGPPEAAAGAGTAAALAPAPEHPPAAGLTPRERDVFELLLKGRKMREIADALGIKYSTVNTHQKSVYRKLGVNSRVECILRYGAPFAPPAGGDAAKKGKGPKT